MCVWFCVCSCVSVLVTVCVCVCLVFVCLCVCCCGCVAVCLWLCLHVCATSNQQRTTSNQQPMSSPDFAFVHIQEWLVPPNVSGLYQRPGGRRSPQAQQGNVSRALQCARCVVATLNVVTHTHTRAHTHLCLVVLRLLRSSTYACASLTTHASLTACLPPFLLLFPYVDVT